MSPTPWKPSKRALARVKDPLPLPTVCPHCGSEVRLVSNAQVYGKPTGRWPWVYACSDTGGTGCDARVGLHPGTNLPLGTLATEPIRRARMEAKALFEPLWQSNPFPLMARKAAYKWLAARMGLTEAQCHFGLFDVDQCEQAAALLRARRAA